MDPNETLARLRALSKAGFPTTDNLEDADEFHTLFDALDEWLSNGGFPPAAWRRPPRIEVIVNRDPDASTELEFFFDGQKRLLGEGAPELTEYHVDPGAGYPQSVWLDSALIQIESASRAAAEALAETFNNADTSFITDNINCKRCGVHIDLDLVQMQWSHGYSRGQTCSRPEPEDNWRDL